MGVANLIGVMIDHYRDRRLAEHALKVYAYARGIGGEEGLTPRDETILCGAAILHDVGIPEAMRLHGSAAGPHQEREGARLAPDLLRKADMPEDMIQRVAWLVGHHHSESEACGDQLLQMLMEADYLVNLSEGNVTGETPAEVGERFFRTATGKRYLRALFPE